MKTKKIMVSNLYTNLPITPGITLWLLLDRLNASGVTWGIYWTLIVIIFIAVLTQIFTTEPVDIFKEES